jgi:hypothetical protein
MSKNKKGAGSKMDDATMWKHMWMGKGLVNVFMEDKCRRVELRSMRIEDMIETLTRDSDGRIAALEDIVDYLNRSLCSFPCTLSSVIESISLKVEASCSDLDIVLDYHLWLWSR